MDQVFFIKITTVFILAILSASCLIYVFKYSTSVSMNANLNSTQQSITAKRYGKLQTVNRNINRQPVCFQLEHFHTQLENIVTQIKIRQTTCFPCEKQSELRRYKINSKSSYQNGKINNDNGGNVSNDENDSRGIGVVWCIVGLLIISMIASIIDVWNAKEPKLKKASSYDIAGKPGAAPRRCSLASLTAARHTRRQQFVTKRPSSIAESHPPVTQQQAAGGKEMSYRRSSSPSTVSDFFILSSSRRNSNVSILGDNSEEESASLDRLQKRNRIRLIRRF